MNTAIALLSSDDGADPGHLAVTLVGDEPRSQSALRLRVEDGREVALDRRMLVGSAPDADLRLEDPRVSRRHCVIYREAGRTLVSDCSSRNGTYIGGVRVAGGELRHGFALTLGRT